MARSARRSRVSSGWWFNPVTTAQRLRVCPEAPTASMTGASRSFAMCAVEVRGEQ